MSSADISNPDAVPEFDRLAAMEDRLLALETQGKWVVYELCYDDAPEVAFYIGITSDLERRVSQHKSDQGSAAYNLCQEGFVYRAIREFNNYPEAKLFESVHIALRPSLANRDIAVHLDKLRLPEEFWSIIDGWERARDNFLKTILEPVRKKARQVHLVALLDEGAEK